MRVVVFFVLCGLVGGSANTEVTLEPDHPYLRVPLSGKATLKCCYQGAKHNLTWTLLNSTYSLLYVSKTPKQDVEMTDETIGNRHCGILIIKAVHLDDTGLYRCFLNSSKTVTHGTFLQAYKVMEKTINLSESTKNTILTIEGILLLLCVIVPSATLLFKSKGLKELEMKKVKTEEENIYQGLNLDDCCTTYDQIERSQVQGQYQDVGSGMEEREEIQLEKP
ncbi:B-cell antigen receptor complex-associated protein alpha chain [Kryptolebias marmoratus]|uniref:CD79a molecule, immunoglobulin-associated alpha n=1 Tax=Kryptolebias marmoratus TaxID=37003 RepID=A0A3Q3AD88_KRYMA|nr:B-cell antigen receptor complex-associated protein alpha chain [Kryptolebias marmoratus]